MAKVDLLQRALGVQQVLAKLGRSATHAIVAAVAYTLPAPPRARRAPSLWRERRFCFRSGDTLELASIWAARTTFPGACLWLFSARKTTRPSAALRARRGALQTSCCSASSEIQFARREHGRRQNNPLSLRLIHLNILYFRTHNRPAYNAVFFAGFPLGHLLARGAPEALSAAPFLGCCMQCQAAQPATGKPPDARQWD